VKGVSQGLSQGVLQGVSFVTLVTSDRFAHLVLNLAASIVRMRSIAPLLVMLPREHSLSEEAVLALEAEEIISVLLVDPLPFAPAGQDFTGERWGSSIWMKLHAFALSHLRKFIFLDADSLLLHNVDELFNLDADFAGVANAAGDVHAQGSCWMTAAMWVGRPSRANYQSMLGWLHLHDRLMFAEQFFLPLFFDGSLRLPAYYSCQFPAVSREPTKIQTEQTIGGQLCRVINACSANAA
jgi:hypothetical protein